MNTCQDCGAPIITLVCDTHWAKRYARDGENALGVLARDVKFARPSFDIDGSMERAERARLAAERKAQQQAKTKAEKKPSKKTRKVKYTSWEVAS